MAALARLADPVAARRPSDRTEAADGSLGRGLLVAMAASLPVWAALAYACWG